MFTFSLEFKFSFQLRRAMVDQRTGSGRLTVRKHFDHMKRATVLNQTYFHQVSMITNNDLTYNVPQAIPDTPFTLGVALPTQYELARVVGGTEVTMDALEGKQQQRHLWTWVRCIK